MNDLVKCEKIFTRLLADKQKMRWKTMEQLVTSKDSQHDDEIILLVERIRELGYAKISGKYAKVSDKTEAKILLAIEEVLAKEEQQKIIESPFVR